MIRRTFLALTAATAFAMPAFADGHSKDIVDTAVAAGSFTTLAAALAWNFGPPGLLVLLWLPWSAYAAWRQAGYMAWVVDERLVAVRGGWWSRWWRFAEVDKLQALRDRVGKPLIVRSAYRSPEHNRAVGGAPASKHIQGTAFDLAMANHEPAAFAAAAKICARAGFCRPSSLAAASRSR